MNILSDKHIVYAEKLFGSLGELKLIDGSFISNEQLKYTDALIVRSVTNVNQCLLNNSQVKFVGTASSGLDHLDQDWLIQSGVKFIGTPGSNAIAVVEYVLSALLYLAKRDGFFLQDKIIGILGVGNIGKLLHQRFKNLGIQTLLCDTPLENAGIREDWCSWEKLVSESDILTLHVPLIFHGRYSTWHKINGDVLDALPENGILINTCRGGVVDENALLRILDKGKKLNIVLDVWENEPILSKSLLTHVDIGTAHIAGSTLEAKVRSTFRLFDYFTRNFVGFKKKHDVSLESLLPKIKHHVQLSDIFSQQVLYSLANLVYDVHKDDLILRRIAGNAHLFEKVRSMHYLSRREWSSLYITTHGLSDSIKLHQLGFYIDDM